MNQYLVPANSKKSKLIFGFFTPVDIGICGFAALLTFVLVIVVRDPSFFEAILIFIPVLIAAMLVFPVPNYHNVRQLLINIFNYAVGRKKYYWKGWCVKDENDE